MAEIISFGEVVKFAELAWQVYHLGWAEAFHADAQYREFGQDVRHLALSLHGLEDVINRARSSLEGQPPGHWDVPGWDHASLFDIIGDYTATLNDCEHLLEENRSYNATTGPLNNIRWNVFVQPQVERLRQRILLHNSKIQQVLRPFELDLHLRIYNALARKIDGLHQQMGQGFQTILEHLHVLMNHFNPALLESIRSNEEEVHQVATPETIYHYLQFRFEEHPNGEHDIPLHDIDDAFTRCFDQSTLQFTPDNINTPPLDQYLYLLTSQFLLDKMLSSSECLNAPPTSHWPSYIQHLQWQLSHECLRFTQNMVPPPLPPHLDMFPELPIIWPEPELPPYIEIVNLTVPMDFLLETELATETPHHWRRLKLYRHCEGGDKRFRMVITAGDQGQPASHSLPVDFDITTATLTPQYATPDSTQGLVIVLNDGRGRMHRLVFADTKGLFAFQGAIMGWGVIDGYMARKVQVIFVMEGGKKMQEEASLQFWRPIRMNGETMTGDASSESGSSRRTSSSGSSPGHVPERPTSQNVQDLGRQFSGLSVSSMSFNIAHGHPPGRTHTRPPPTPATNPPQNSVPRQQPDHFGSSDPSTSRRPLGHGPVLSHRPSNPNQPYSSRSDLHLRTQMYVPQTPSNTTLNGNQPRTAFYNSSPRAPSFPAPTRASSASSSRGSTASPTQPTSYRGNYNTNGTNIASRTPNSAPSTGNSSISGRTRHTPNSSSSNLRSPSGSSRWTSSPLASPTTIRSPFSQVPLPPLHEDSISPTSNTVHHSLLSAQVGSPPPYRNSPSRSSTTSSASNLPQASLFSARPPSRGAASIISTTSITSISSRRTLSVSALSTTSPVATLHTKPTEPLLVLFTRPRPRRPPRESTRETNVGGPSHWTGSSASGPSVVAIPLDPKTNVNYRMCDCSRSVNCDVASLDRGRGGPLSRKEEGTLSVFRTGGSGLERGMNILPMARALMRRNDPSSSSSGAVTSQRGVMRVSIRFAAGSGRGPGPGGPSSQETFDGGGDLGIPGASEGAEARREFSGLPCQCEDLTEGELLDCLIKGHRGKLGWVKEMHRRELVKWDQMRHRGLKDVVGVGE
ncbi:hypothetical protein B0T18DRAFT_93446 [Schizothecium vesticola]|uniref:Uncharacterized protein n=1 Tax=Schizothecium vesticola TaxID=314040 RepID=A0AA40F7H3_9PEZI|nr:hypothetical protein B0T18DRAFT_93446 [Schizothecium vesticola]